MSNTVSIDFNFASSLPRSMPGSGSIDCYLLFLGPIIFKVNGVSFTDTERVFWFTQEMMSKIDRMIYLGWNEQTVSYMESSYYLGLKYDQSNSKVDIFASELKEGIWSMPHAKARCDALELAREVGHLHQSALRQIDLLSERNPNIDFVKSGIRFCSQTRDL